MTHALPSNSPGIRQELPSFWVGENAYMTGASVALIVGSVVLVATAVALTILFPPAGAVAIASMATLFVFGGGFGIAGVALTAYVFHKYRAHEKCVEQEHAHLLEKTTKAKDFASAVMSLHGKKLIENSRCLYTAQYSEHYSSSFMNSLKHLLDSLKLDWDQYTFTKNTEPLDLIAHCLSLLFCKKGEGASPLIPLLPRSIGADEWKRLMNLAQAAQRVESSEDKANDARTRIYHPTFIRDGDRAAKGELIPALQGHFATQPRCVKEYLIMHCLYLRDGGKNLPDYEKNALIYIFTYSFYFPFIRELEFAPASDELAKFIITHADELFPEEFAKFNSSIRSFEGLLPQVAEPQGSSTVQIAPSSSDDDE